MTITFWFRQNFWRTNESVCITTHRPLGSESRKGLTEPRMLLPTPVCRSRHPIRHLAKLFSLRYFRSLQIKKAVHVFPKHCVMPAQLQGRKLTGANLYLDKPRANAHIRGCFLYPVAAFAFGNVSGNQPNSPCP